MRKLKLSTPQIKINDGCPVCGTDKYNRYHYLPWTEYDFQYYKCVNAHEWFEYNGKILKIEGSRRTNR